jgi:hypothetical protein
MRMRRVNVGISPADRDETRSSPRAVTFVYRDRSPALRGLRNKLLPGPHGCRRSGRSRYRGDRLKATGKDRGGYPVPRAWTREEGAYHRFSGM